MKITITRLCIVFVFLAGFILALNSCKKTESTSNPTLPSRAEAIEKFKENFKNAPVTTMYEMNIAGKGYYGDADGNHIDWSARKKSKVLYDCPDPSDDYFSQSVIYVKSEHTCGQGFRIEVQYNVSVLYNLVKINPANSSQFSKGKLRLKNSGGTVVWSDTNIPVITITNLGADPSDATLTRFSITYKSGYIADATYNGSASAEPSLFMYTDCSSVPSINIGYSSQQSILTTANYTTPCTRIDKVWFNPRSGSTPPSVGGVNVAGGCSIPGYIYPDQQDIQYYKGSSWVPIPLVFYGTYPSTPGIITNYDFWFVDESSPNGIYTPGTYQVRYRNKQLSTYGGPCTTAPANTWVVESWYIN